MSRLACLALLVAVLSGCVGQGNDYIHVDIDGKPMKFDVEPYAYVYDRAGAIQSVTLGGKRSQAENTSRVHFGFNRDGFAALGPGQYSDLATTMCGYEGDLTNPNNDYENSPDHLCTITATRVDRDRIEGTFTARLHRVDTDNVITLTDGRFSVAVRQD